MVGRPCIVRSEWRKIYSVSKDSFISTIWKLISKFFLPKTEQLLHQEKTTTLRHCWWGKEKERNQIWMETNWFESLLSHIAQRKKQTIVGVGRLLWRYRRKKPLLYLSLSSLKDWQNKNVNNHWWILSRPQKGGPVLKTLNKQLYCLLSLKVKNIPLIKAWSNVLIQRT